MTDSYIILYRTLAHLVNDNAYPDYIPEQVQRVTPPYIIYREIDAVADNVLDEFLGAEYVRVQIDVYHTTHLECRILSNEIIQAMLTNINHCEYVSRQRLFDPDTSYARYSMDFQFFLSI